MFVSACLYFCESLCLLAYMNQPSSTFGSLSVYLLVYARGMYGTARTCPSCMRSTGVDVATCLFPTVSLKGRQVAGADVAKTTVRVDHG